jgi:hypothetical protein
MDKRGTMDKDRDEENPLVPHNSMTMIDCGRSTASSRQQNYPKQDPSKRVQIDNVSGKEVIDALKSRLYDRPENSEVFKSILRPAGCKVSRKS